MKAPPIGPSARCFEDFTLGDTFITQGRTLTQADALFFAMFTGDMNPMHVDHEFAKKYGLYGGVFAPGLATVAIASGLNERLGLFVGTGLAMTSQTIRYLKVVLPGDTVKVRLEVKSLTPHKRRPAGSVEFGYQIVRGDGVVCVEGEWNILLSARNATSTKVRSNSDVPEAGSSEVGG